MSARLRVGLCVACLWAALPMTAARAQLFSPGPLSEAHRSLEGDDHCGDCHSSGRQVSARKCLDCHDELDARVRAGRGLHGTEYRGRPCEGCHVEHVGRRAPQIRWPGGSRERFDHALTGWPLRGGHRAPECADCHGRGRSYLGLGTACSSCHDDDDPHEGRFGRNCQSCHDETRWSSVRIESFDHGLARFPLRGRHQQVACAGCHHEPPQYRGIAFDRCTSCHEDPHAGSYGEQCTNCHNESGWRDLGRIRQTHPRLSLAGGHRRVSCGRCHDRGVDAAPSRGSRCVSCHRDVHEAPFGNDCASCHGGIRWLELPAEVSLSAHRRTAFPLEGAHDEVECRACHDPARPVNARYRELTFERCSACHEDPHAGSFADWGEQGDCATCHDARGFWPSRFGVALHARTEYPLEGRHEVVACSGCHGTTRPRTTFAVEERRCEGCHENPHGDQFADEMREAGCEGCHATSGFDRPRIDHATWPLTGAHATAACDGCHRPSAADREAGRGASYRGVPRICAGCHRDVHAGQFRLSEPVRTCPVCHDTRSFAIETFDHAGIAGYPLTGQHAEVACAGCHPSVGLGRGREATRYRLGYRGCGDCHADPHTPPPGQALLVPPPFDDDDEVASLLASWLEVRP